MARWDNHETPTYEEKLDQANARHARERRDLLTLLGGCCARCGFDDYRALQIDHVKGDGAAEHRGARKLDPRRQRQRVEASWRSGERGKYQILCANCNQIKRVENGESGGRKRAIDSDDECATVDT
jgi:hypothetical protein